MNSSVSSIDTPCVKSKRRSSIFKPCNLKDQQQVELDINTNYPDDYKKLLQQEVENWKSITCNIKDEYVKLETNLTKHMDINGKNIATAKDLELLDHTLYFDYLQSITNIFTQFECLQDKKEQQKIIRKYHSNTLIKAIEDI